MSLFVRVYNDITLLDAHWMSRFAYPESDYHGITVSDNMRIQVDMFMTSTPHRLPLVDWLLFVSLGIFLVMLLVVFIFWLVDKPLPAHLNVLIQ